MGFIYIKPTKIKNNFYLPIPKTVRDIASVKKNTDFLIKINYGSPNPKITIVQKAKAKSKRRRRK